MAPSHLRTCIGCRQKDSARALARLTVETAELRVWRHRAGPGRGASLHPTPACVSAALRPGVLGRAFRKPVDAPRADLLLERLRVVTKEQKEADKSP